MSPKGDVCLCCPNDPHHATIDDTNDTDMEKLRYKRIEGLDFPVIDGLCLDGVDGEIQFTELELKSYYKVCGKPRWEHPELASLLASEMASYAKQCEEILRVLERYPVSERYRCLSPRIFRMMMMARYFNKMADKMRRRHLCFFSTN